MQSRSKWLMLSICTILMLLLPLVAPALPALAQADEPPGPAKATESLAASTGQLLYSDLQGQLIVQCWRNGAFVQPACWQSGADNGWSNAITGDFNGDGKAEIAAVRQSLGGDRIKVFNPAPGTDPVYIDDSMPSPQVFYQLAAGDFLGLGYDQIAVTFRNFTSPPTGPEYLRLYYYVRGQGASGMRRVDGFTFPYAVQAMSAGLVNFDNLADLVVLSQTSNQMNILWGNGDAISWSQQQFRYGENNRYGYPWNTVVVGNLTNIYRAQEIAWSIQAPAPQWSMLASYFIPSSFSLQDFPLPDPAHSPSYTVLALGDVDGDGVSEIFALRVLDRNSTSTFLQMFNPSGAALPAFELAGYGGGLAWKRVAAGYLNDNKHASIALIRASGLRVYTGPPYNLAYQDLSGNLSETVLAIADFGLNNATMAIVPNALTYSILKNQSPVPALISVNSDPAGVPYTYATGKLAGSTWLNLSAVGGTAPNTFTISINAADPNLVSGTYQDIVRVTATGAPNLVGILYRDINVQVSLPTLQVSPSTPVTFNFDANSYLQTRAQSFTVANSNTADSVAWQASLSGSYISPVTGRQWLFLDPPSGVTPGSINIRASAQDAGVSSLQALLNVTSAYNTVSIPINIVVADPVFVTNPPAASFTHVLNGATTPPSRIVQLVQPAGGSSVTWSATVNPAVNWLHLSSNTGQTPGSMTLTIDAAPANAAGAGLKQTSIVYQSGTTQRVVPVYLLVASQVYPLYCPLMTK
jgi:hypothetical protein